MRISKRPELLIIIALVAFGSTSVYASSREVTAEGNRAYDAGEYDQALAAYDKALADLPESAQLYFNQGAAQYMKGDYPKARESFEEAAIKTEELSLKARSQYNLGNCSFRESENQGDKEPEKIMKGLGQAIRYYQQALELDPELKDAAHNIEIARLIIKQIQDEIKKQQEQQQQQQQQQQEQAEKLKQLIEEQEKLAQESEALNDKKQENEKSEEQQQQEPQQQQQQQKQEQAQKQKTQQLASEQQQLNDKTKELSEQMDAQQGEQDKSAEKAKEHLQKAMSKQEKAEKDLQKEDFSKAKPSQESAAEEMKKALEAISADKDKKPEEQKDQDKKESEQQEEPQDQGQQGEEQQDQEGKQEPKEANPVARRDEDAHNIIDEERENREERQLSIPGSYQPVDKDW